MKRSSSRTYNPIIGEIRDDNGVWHTGWQTFGRLAQLVGTTTTDLMRRLTALGIVEYRDERHRLTPWARQKGYGTVYRRKRRPRPDLPVLAIDVVLPEGMVLLVQNLEATNLPLTETERLRNHGLTFSAMANRLGVSRQAVHKRLNGLPPRLKNWPVVGTWADKAAADNDNSVNRPASAA